jgi:endonuclease YncB( thermonuclease family)
LGKESLTESKNGREVLTGGAYKALAESLGKLITESDKTGRAADSNKAKVNWEIGDKLVAAGLIGRNHYGESVLERLAEDIKSDPQTLRRCIVFRQVYDRQNLYRGVQNLTWSAYRLLIEIHDDEARRFYEDKAIQGKWSRDRLRTAIASREYEREVKKDPDAAILKRPTEGDYVYRADVLECVDGDTLRLDVQCGFYLKMDIRIRLAGLDAPEITTKKGKEAAEYVRDRLAKARGIVVKTVKMDIHGRFVGHVFYSFETDNVWKVFTEGVFLNDELLQKKLATRL